MTLTDIMPTLRMSIPDPIDLSAWPAQTTTTTDDVAVERLSMLRVSGLLGTPCEWTGERASRSGCRTVMVCRVSAIVRDGDEPIVLVDCAAQRIGADWSHARLIGRISVAYKGSHRILGDGSRPQSVSHPLTTPGATQSEAVSLPLDLAVGDLLIVPCRPTEANVSFEIDPVQA